jgi:hypothetical protein
MPAKLDEWSIKTPQVYDSAAIFLIFQLNKYFSGRIGGSDFGYFISRRFNTD